MGLICLHSAHFSKIFKTLMGTNCSLKWREAGEKERLWVIERGHQIAEGLGEYFELPHTEMYGERFDIPQPDELVFVSWFEGGEVFRSGCCWRRGHGKVFYFRPGHETFPIFKDANVLKVITNAVRWAKPTVTSSRRRRTSTSRSSRYGRGRNRREGARRAAPTGIRGMGLERRGNAWRSCA